MKNQVILTYSESLDATSLTAEVNPVVFTVRVRQGGGSWVTRTISSASIIGAVVTLTLALDIAYGDEVDVSTTGNLKDIAGNIADLLTAQLVTNNIPNPNLSAPTLSMSSGGLTSIVMNWSNITNNSGYEVRTSPNGVDSWSSWIAVATNVTTYNVTGLVENQTVYGQVRTIGTGEFITSVGSIVQNATTNANAAPTVGSVFITNAASTHRVGDTLTGNGTYSDTENDLQGASITKWYRSDTLGGTKTAISGATSLTYTLVSADIDKYIWFGYTPVAQTGTLQGTEVISAATSQILNLAAPTLSTPATDPTGLIIELTFNKSMANPSAQTGLITLSGGKTVNSLNLKSGYANIIQVNVNSAYAAGDAITITIASGLAPADGGYVYAGESLSVTNNVPTITEYSVSTWNLENLTRSGDDLISAGLASARAYSSDFLAANAEGYIQMTVDNALCKGAAIGFDTAATMEGHTAWDYSAFSNSAAAGDYGSIAWYGWGASSNPTITNGMIIRIERYLTGGVYHMRLRYKELAGSWVTHLDNVDVTGGAKLYIKARCTTSASIANVRINKIMKSWV